MSADFELLVLRNEQRRWKPRLGQRYGSQELRLCTVTPDAQVRSPFVVNRKVVGSIMRTGIPSRFFFVNVINHIFDICFSAWLAKKLQGSGQTLTLMSKAKFNFVNFLILIFVWTLCSENLPDIVNRCSRELCY